METEYEYDGQRWYCYPTLSDESNFYHSVFGAIVGNRPCCDKDADCRRKRWSDFLRYFKFKEKPIWMNQFLQNLSINDQASYEEYTADVSLSTHRVRIEEIPLLASLENIKIVVLTHHKMQVIEPSPELIEDYRQTVKNPLKEVVICHDGSNFSRLCVKNTYTKLGDAGVKGGEYQTDLLTLFLLNGLKKVKKWRLSTEDVKAGKFDDLIFEYMPKANAILLQAKHRKDKKKKITRENLLSTNLKNDDFSLPKYFFTYLEIRDKFNIESIVLCTNVDIKDEKKSILNKEDLDEDDMLNFTGSGACRYTFNYEIISDLVTNAKIYCNTNLKEKNISPDVVTLNDVKRFLNNLQFLANFGNSVSLDKVINNTIANMPEYSKNLDVATMGRYLYKKMFDWFKAEKGTYLTQTDAKAFFCDIRSHNYRESLRSKGITFKQCGIDLSSSGRILHIIAQEEYILSAMKIERALEKEGDKALFVNPDESSDVRQQMLSAFALPYYTFLVLIGTTNEDNVIEINNVISKSNYKKLVIISSENEVTGKIEAANGTLFERREDQFSFRDLSDISQTKLLQIKNINFQQNYMNLAEFLGHISTIDDIIDPATSVRLINNEIIVIGSEVKHSEKNIEAFYVPRTFHSTEAKMCQVVKKCDEKIVLISDTAGMGKSTVLTQMAVTIKAENPHLWVIRADLNSYTKFLEQCINESRDIISLEEFLNAVETTKLKNDLEYRIFKMKSKVVLMLDGLDEISPDYTKLIMNLLETSVMGENILNVFVTTRPNIQKILEDALHVTSYAIEPFSKKNQIDFLRNYWTKNLGIENLRCEVYAECLLNKMSQWLSDGCWRRGDIFVGIPLQMKMIADVFQKSSKDNEWEGCDEFQKSMHKEPKLPDTLDLIKLYEMFVEVKRGILMNIKYTVDGNTLATKLMRQAFADCQSYHKKLALDIVFEEKYCSLFKDHRTGVPNLEYILKLGIVQQINNQLGFIHRTFAEFYAAKCLMTELENRDKMYLEFLVTDVLRESENNVIRTFFNKFLKTRFETCPILLLDYMQEFLTNFTSDPQKTFKYKTFLNTLAEEGCFETIQFLLGHTHLNYILGFKYDNGETILHLAAKNGDICLIDLLYNQHIDLNLADEAGNTALHHAAKEHNLNVVQCLCDKNNNVNIRNAAGETPLHYAVFENQEEIVKCLVRNKADSEIRDERGFGVLHHAVFIDVKLLEALLTQGVNVEFTDSIGQTALHHAVKKGDIFSCQILIKYNANVNARNNWGFTPLHIAVDEVNYKIVDLLITNGADFAKTDENKQTVLHLAAKKADNGIFRLLVKNDAGANIYDKDANGCLCLHIAAEYGRLDTVKYLLGILPTLPSDYGEAADNSGRRPLHYAAGKGHLDVVKLLVRWRRVDVNISDHNGHTAIYEAARGKHVNVVKFLANHGGVED